MNTAGLVGGLICAIIVIVFLAKSTFMDDNKTNETENV